MVESKPAPARRRWLVPEAVQASPMDCGPTALHALLAGFDLSVSYDRLRDACKTDVDGTSIDALASVAREQGLDARQLLVPLEQIGDRFTRNLPAITVTRLPGGALHFVLVWRRVGPWLQIMDPASGRRWVSARQLRAGLHREQVEVPARRWRASRATLADRALLTASLRKLGHPRAAELAQGALELPGWRPLAALEATARMVHSLVASGAVSRGRAAARMVDALYERAVQAPSISESHIPAVYWSVRPVGPPDDAPGAGEGSGPAPGPGSAQELLTVHGALIVRVREMPRAADGAGEPGVGPGSGAARRRRRRRPAWDVRRAILGFVPGLDRLRAGGIALFSGLAALTVLTQALLFRALFGLGDTLQGRDQRLGAVALLLTFMVALALLELPLADGLMRLGRHLEARVRQRFQESLPRLPFAWLDSRPGSDMAERAHALFGLREFPLLAGRLVRTAVTLALTAGALAWLDPGSLPLIALAMLCSVGLPLVLQPGLQERELLVRGHHGALSRFYLEALLGLVAVRVHGAQRTLRREHEALLVEWHRAGTKLIRGTLALRIASSLLTTAVAVGLVVDHLVRAGATPASFLFAYWAIALPAYGEQLVHGLLAVHPLENAARRALEPLAARPGDEQDAPQAAGAADPSGRAPASEDGCAAHGAPGSPASPASPGAGPQELAATSRPGLKAAGATAFARISEERAPAAPGAPRIELRGVGLVRSARPVLAGLDLVIEPGEHVALVGRSGAGKSSLIAMLLGFVPPSSGELLVDGDPLLGDALDRLRRASAWVDPAVQLWNRSVFGNLIYGVGSTSEGELARALDDARLSELAATLPEGLATSVGEGGCFVSGGEGQRLRLARALLRPDVRLALLDEPLRGVDRDARAALLARARQRWAHATLLCATHDLAQSLEFDRVLVLEDGRLVEDGAPRQLLERGDSAYARLMGAERDLLERGWRAAGWTRWRVASGRLSVEANGGAAESPEGVEGLEGIRRDERRGGLDD